MIFVMPVLSLGWTARAGSDLALGPLSPPNRAFNRLTDQSRTAKPPPVFADSSGMELTIILMELIFAATLMRSLLVAANVLPPTCANCGQQLERRELGEPVCRCAH
jgi:hypothetical protein